MPGISLELQLRDSNNLPVGFYSSISFSQVALPTKTGRFVCTLALQPLFLASGDYSFDVTTKSLSIITDHEVLNAVPFHVTTRRLLFQALPLNWLSSEVELAHFCVTLDGAPVESKTISLPLTMPVQVVASYWAP